jgi:hypothetical protein
MNLDEFENKLRSQPRREIPPEWRREILGSLRGKVGVAAPWWRQLLWPHPAAWGALATLWMAVFAFHLAAGPDTPPRARVEKKADADMFLAYEERKRLWAEFATELAPNAQRRTPATDRPRSYRAKREVAV